MFGFGRKKAARTFVEATGGGWGDAPEKVAADGGAHADYVGDVLRLAREQALAQEIEVGGEFEYVITDIPYDIISPHGIIFGLIMRAHEQGLVARAMCDEVVYFVRAE